MKRISLLLLASFSLLLAACSQPTASPELQGQWTGALNGVPVAFEVQADGKVTNDSFQFCHNSECLYFNVTSHATDNALDLLALATNTAGDSLSFHLKGRVNGNTLTVDYTLTLNIDGNTTQTSGTFTMTRIEL